MTELDKWLEYIGQVHPVGWDLGLERVAEVGAKLGVLHPARQVILVAGTNGKGSTCEYLSQFAQRNNLRVGKTTSPHLRRFNERIELDGQPVPDEVIVDAFTAVEAARENITLTYFEFAALAAFVIFKAADLDIAVCEVGLGGRLDAMNIVTPDLCIITSIAMDHESWLGDSRETIATEKAGIMRPGVTCLVADRDPPVALITKAGELQSPLEIIGSHFAVPDAIQTHLPIESFAVARRAVELLGHDPAPAVGIAENTTLPGRMTWRQSGCKVLLDVAHNPAAAERLAAELRQLNFGAIWAVFGVYADKDIDGIVSPLTEQIDSWFLVSSGEERSMQTGSLQTLLSDKTHGKCHSYAKIASALEAAVDAAAADDLILVFGSFPIVAEGLDFFESE